MNGISLYFNNFLLTSAFPGNGARNACWYFLRHSGNITIPMSSAGNTKVGTMIINLKQ